MFLFSGVEMLLKYESCTLQIDSRLFNVGIKLLDSLIINF